MFATSAHAYFTQLTLVKVVEVKSYDSALPTLQMVKVDLSYAHYYCTSVADFKFLLRVVRDVDKAEIGCVVTFIILQ